MTRINARPLPWQGAIEWRSCATAGALKAQGATEYLVLLAVVLIIALVAIALLGFFPGLSNDAKFTQNRAFWESASPIAIVDGVGADQATYLNNPDGGEDALLLTLKNNGGEAVELLYMSSGGPDESIIFDDYGTRTSIGGPTYLTQYQTQGSYTVYVAAPRGTGFASYSQSIILQPGETVTVGTSIVGANDPAMGGMANYAPRICKKSTDASVGQIMDIKDFVIAYGVITDGFKTYKYQKGELMLHCISDLGV